MIIDTRPTASTSTVRSATRVPAARAIMRGAALVAGFDTVSLPGAAAVSEVAAVGVDPDFSGSAGSLVSVGASAVDEAEAAFGAGAAAFRPPSRL